MSPWLRVVASLLGGVLIGAAFGGRGGVAAGVVVSVVCWLLLRRAESPRVRRERAAARVDLPFAADLLAAALHAGAAPDRAAYAVGRSMGAAPDRAAGRSLGAAPGRAAGRSLGAASVGGRLVTIGRALRGGAPPADAWGQLGEIPGGNRLARAATRSAEHGTALAQTFEKQAADLRRDRAAFLEARVRKTSVYAVLPVGLCFLPAFVLVGVVPVVAALLGEVFAAL
ncbi:type II secretion system F family protein [Dactylosporangium sp. AC04546]|uniref:type II secretion system F family protein n=1 Tax=Dactylosporangium sp. AC04546 TaxID=2862460 RepID=UPI001EDFA60E|nr:type II secretion system F family protein [Dactylosporangium sp. AC04546]WVK84091.1 type II secretion system F family protein [Dactylosporangium sp. AC04546]